MTHTDTNCDASSPDINHGLMISNDDLAHFQVEAILRQLCSNRKVDKAGPEEPKAVTFALKG